MTRPRRDRRSIGGRPGNGPASLCTLPRHARPRSPLACGDGHRAPPHRVDRPARPGRRPRDRRSEGGRFGVHRPDPGPRLPGGRNRSDRRRGSRAVPAGLVGRHRGVGPAGPGRERRGARRHRRHRLHRPVVGHRARRRHRDRHRPGHQLDGLPGRPRRPRDRARCAQRPGLLRLQGWRSGCAAPAASRACRARTRSGTSTSCASSAPRSTPPPRSSSSRSTTSTCASPGWPGPRTTPSPCTG